jgi:hypothetical protein
MAFWGAVAAAAIAAAASYASKSMEGGGSGPAGKSVGGKEPVQTINPFGDKKAGPLMGGSGTPASGEPLSKALEQPSAPTTQPSFQPQVNTDEEERKRLAAMFGGIA